MACFCSRCLSGFVFVPRFIKRILRACSYFMNLLNKLRKRDKMRGLPSILPLFRNKFNKFNNTEARMLDFIYHLIQIILNHMFGVKTLGFCPMCDVKNIISFTSGLSILMRGVISLPDAASYDN